MTPKTIKAHYHFYSTRKFLGLVISFDFDRAQCNPEWVNFFSIEVKFLFVGFWISFEKKYKS